MSQRLLELNMHTISSWLYAFLLTTLQMSSAFSACARTTIYFSIHGSCRNVLIFGAVAHAWLNWAGTKALLSHGLYLDKIRARYKIFSGLLKANVAVQDVICWRPHRCMNRDACFNRAAASTDINDFIARPQHIQLWKGGVNIWKSI